MITIDEIRNVAAQVQLANTVVEKDYALGWLLWGIHQHPFTRDDWVFKGGTCLKKCYFETYRFSEDLDFSFRGKEAPTAEALTKKFSEISDAILQEAGVEFVKSTIDFEIFQNPRGTISIQGGMKYRSLVRPNVGVNHMQKIKIDLTLDEPVVLPPLIKNVDHPYSDKPSDGINVLAYAYEEVFAEKTRALAQRLRPRDLYDVIHFFRRTDLNVNRDVIYNTLENKCRLRGIEIPTIEAINTHENRSALESEWDGQLKHQIQILPDFSIFLDELPHALNWISGTESETLDQLTANQPGEQEQGIQSESIQGLVPLGISSSFLDRIRFASANRFIVKLGYEGRYRNIEPYSLARSTAGNLLLRAVKTEGREVRTYRWDRIESVEVTTKNFVPQYKVEITSAGHLPIHQLTRKQSPS